MFFLRPWIVRRWVGCVHWATVSRSMSVQKCKSIRHICSASFCSESHVWTKASLISVNTLRVFSKAVFFNPVMSIVPHRVRLLRGWISSFKNLFSLCSGQINEVKLVFFTHFKMNNQFWFCPPFSCYSIWNIE